MNLEVARERCEDITQHSLRPSQALRTSRYASRLRTTRLHTLGHKSAHSVYLEVGHGHGPSLGQPFTRLLTVMSLIRQCSVYTAHTYIFVAHCCVWTRSSGISAVPSNSRCSSPHWTQAPAEQQIAMSYQSAALQLSTSSHHDHTYSHPRTLYVCHLLDFYT